jgi:phage tail-like protein
MADDKSGQRQEPLTTFHFGLKIDAFGMDKATAFFKSISGLSLSSDSTPYQEGGVSGFYRQVIGPTKYQNIVLKRGFTGDLNLWDWYYNPQRVDGSIFALGRELMIMARWDFKRAYPVKWEGPPFDADKNEIAIESLEFAHQGFTFKKGE